MCGCLSAIALREMAPSCLLAGKNFASLEVNLGGGWGQTFSLPFLFSQPLSGRSPDMTEILLTGTLPLIQYFPI